MIRTLALQVDGAIIQDVPPDTLKKMTLQWYWVDFNNPSAEEEQELTKVFQFHPLAIEDCIEKGQQRPKLDRYDDYLFLLVHSLTPNNYDALELDLFVNEKMLVTFHHNNHNSVDHTWNSIVAGSSTKQYSNPVTLVHTLIDQTVDEYFPYVYGIEDLLDHIEERTDENSSHGIMDRLFDVRHDMQKLRRSLVPLRDLLYRLLNSNNTAIGKEQQLYFQDVYDHVLKLVEMLESYREFSSDIRDNYISISSDKMNNIMMTLTVITTIFMPLTFIAGLYGMNFINIPELQFENGYFIVLVIMGSIALMMFGMFRKIGWLTFSRSKKKKRRKIFLR